MALDPDPHAVLLPCGRDPVDVWDHAGDAADQHEQGCPYCQEVRREHAGVSVLTRNYLDERVEAPDALFQRVMESVRTGIRARDPIELTGPRGPIRIDPITAETILRWSLDQLDDVRVRTCDILTLNEAPVPVVNVEVGVETRAGAPIPVLLGRVRAMVRTLALQTLSLPVERVDVEVTDLFGEAP